MNELWREYSKTKDRGIKNKLIEKNIELAKIIAGRMYNFYGSKIEYDDLLSYGVMGLIDSIERFDLDKNVKFETYAQIRIRGTIIDNIRKLDWIPRSLRKKSKDIQEAMIKLENQYGRSPSNIELAEYLNMSLEELETALSDTSNFNVSSLENLLINKGEYNIDTSKNQDTPDEIFEEEEMKEILASAIDDLGKQEKTVISLYYYEELTYKEIGAVMELSESRISQIHSKAILELKNQLIKKDVYEN